jgi:small-conductance mechanosensitive channel
MDFDFNQIFTSDNIYIASYIGLSLAIGLVFDRLFIVFLSSVSKKTKWSVDDILIDSLKNVVVIWFLIGGIYFTLWNVESLEEYNDTIVKVTQVLLIASVFVFLLRLGNRIINKLVSENKVQGASLIYNITRLTILSLGILIILQNLGISITPLLTALGVGGIAVALALQETLSSLVAGVNVIVSRKIRPGDYISLDSNEEGYVVDITWRNTTIKSLPNNLIIIPNQKLGGAIVTNYYGPDKEMAVLIDVGVSYDSDLEKVEEVTNAVSKEVMHEVAGGVEEFEPFIRYNQFGDSSINFTVILRAKEFVDQYLIKHEFVKRLHKAYQKNNIEIPFPIRTIKMEK